MRGFTHSGFLRGIVRQWAWRISLLWLFGLALVGPGLAAAETYWRLVWGDGLGYQDPGEAKELCETYQANLAAFPDLPLHRSDWPMHPSFAPALRDPDWQEVPEAERMDRFMWFSWIALHALSAKSLDYWGEKTPEELFFDPHYSGPYPQRYWLEERERFEAGEVRFERAPVDFNQDGRTEWLYRGGSRRVQSPPAPFSTPRNEYIPEYFWQAYPSADDPAVTRGFLNLVLEDELWGDAKDWILFRNRPYMLMAGGGEMNDRLPLRGMPRVLQRGGPVMYDLIIFELSWKEAEGIFKMHPLCAYRYDYYRWWQTHSFDGVNPALRESRKRLSEAGMRD